MSSSPLWYDSFKLFFKKTGKTFKLPKQLIKTEMSHDEVDGYNYKEKKGDWLDYVKQDVLCIFMFF